LALFAVVTSDSRRNSSTRVATVARVWTACVLVFYGIENILFPQFSPGVPATMPTAAWVPAPHVVAYVTGALLVVCGLAMLVRKRAASAAAWAGLLVTMLTVGLYVPQFFIAKNVADRVNAINFIFDTLLFGGTILIVGAAARLRINDTETIGSTYRAAHSERAVPV
jgi:uncharacterized membrane protein YphA (DoxX/SURF4 family)